MGKSKDLHRLLNTEYAIYLISHSTSENFEKFQLEAIDDKHISIYFQITYTIEYFYLKAYTNYDDYRKELRISDLFPDNLLGFVTQITYRLNHKTINSDVGTIQNIPGVSNLQVEGKFKRSESNIKDVIKNTYFLFSYVISKKGLFEAKLLLDAIKKHFTYEMDNSVFRKRRNSSTVSVLTDNYDISVYLEGKTLNCTTIDMRNDDDPVTIEIDHFHLDTDMYRFEEILLNLK